MRAWLVVLVLAAVVAGMWLVREDEADGDATADVLPGEQRLEAPRGEPAVVDLHASAEETPLRVVPPPEAPDAADATDADDAEPRARLVVRVIREEDGTPVEGVGVDARIATPTARWAVARDAQTFDEDASRLVSDADGELVLAFTEATRVVRIAVEPGPDTTRRVDGTDTWLPLGDDVLRELTVPPGATIRGTVVDLEDRPLAGLEVAGWSRQRWSVTADTPPDRLARADAAGRFTLEHMGPVFVIQGLANGEWAPHRCATGELRPDRGVDGVRVRMSRARTLIGRVLAPGGRGVGGAEVALQRWVQGEPQLVDGAEGVFHERPLERLVETAGDGGFEIDGLARQSYDVEVDAPGFPLWEGEHAPGDGELVVRLSAGTRLVGYVFAATGGPVEGARVRIASGDWVRNSGGERTDARGRFVLDGLHPDDDGVLAVHAEGHAVHVEQPVVIAEDAPEVRVVLVEGLAIAGRVVDEHGGPVETAQVSIEGDRAVDYGDMVIVPTPTWERRLGLDTTVTGADGRFRLPDLYDGEFELTAESADGEVTVTRLVRSGTEDVELVLDPDVLDGVVLAGVVRDAATGAPVPRFTLTPMVSTGNGGAVGFYHEIEDEDGAFRISGLDEGEIAVNVRAPGYAQWSAPATHYEEGEHHLAIDMVASRRATLRVVDTSGAPVEGARLAFRGEDGERLSIESGIGVRRGAMTTDAEGRAIVAGLPATRLMVEVEQRGQVRATTREIDLTLEPAHEFVLTVERAAPPVFVTVVPVRVADPARPPLAPAVGTRDAVLVALDEDLRAGRAAPLSVPARVEVRDGGELLRTWTIAAPDEDDPATGGLAPSTLGASLPREPLTLVVHAEGHESATQAWQPPDEPDEPLTLLFALPAAGG